MLFRSIQSLVRIFVDEIQRVVDVLNKEGSIGLEERPHLVGKRIHGMTNDQSLGVASPGKQLGRE